MAEESFIKEEAAAKISVYTPIIYVVVMITALVVFSVVYRRRNVKHLQEMKPFFPENIPREIYFQLKYQEPKPNDKVLKAALIRRGSEAIRRMMKLRENQQHVKLLYERGSIGDELFLRHQFASKIQELELQELGLEAESYKQGWAPTFFAVCQEVTFNEALRRRVKAVDERKQVLSAEWGLVVESAEKKVEKKVTEAAT
ncbi:unnamed protein product [Kuraishia capsulata CBS 1993]|uniref:Translocation protein SEC66 n=1 Tax=Kuraishia capsulata CBS 1993 TaxID=1382522 RepID=W6MND9_9ASCO|nr:uncharacterized protein KUCA_T00004117001 [Kuraishia capsulata CBS 1993]CDK28136.1 unnamed protein product [Kuraishia capsulata CBS 1993]